MGEIAEELKKWTMRFALDVCALIQQMPRGTARFSGIATPDRRRQPAVGDLSASYGTAPRKGARPTRQTA
jgi:hypothetical protein